MFDALGQRLLLNNCIQLQLSCEKIILHSKTVSYSINQLSSQYLVIANYIAINWIIMFFFRSGKAFNLSNVAADVYEEPEVLESVEVCKSVLPYTSLFYNILFIVHYVWILNRALVGNWWHWPVKSGETGSCQTGLELKTALELHIGPDSSLYCLWLLQSWNV